MEVSPSTTSFPARRGRSSYPQTRAFPETYLGTICKRFVNRRLRSAEDRVSKVENLCSGVFDRCAFGVDGYPYKTNHPFQNLKKN